MTVRRDVVAALCAVVLAACAATGGDGDSPAPTSVTMAAAASVGPLPPPLSTVTMPVSSTSTTLETSSTSSTLPPEPSTPVGELVVGSRVLMIGDSILASVSKRYGNEVCEVMTPLGWRIEIEAEVSRFIDFGLIVADTMLEREWDAVVIFLGTNYNRDAEQYFKLMNRLINRFGDRPVVLVTVGERDADMVDVNRVLRALDEAYANVTIVDWAAATAADPGLLADDLIHPSQSGRQMLAMLLAQRFGPAPPDAGKGRCLDQVFIDDTGGIPGFPTTTTTTTTVSMPRTSTTTTVSRSTTTTSSTVPRSSTTTTVPRSTTTTAATTTTNAPPTTAAPTTTSTSAPTPPPG